MARPVAQVVSEDVGAVRVLRLDNEAKRNAFSGSMADDLLRLLQEADATPGVRCVVVTGAGDKAFSSGHDLTEVLGDSEAAVGPDANRAFIHPSKMAKPVIAAVNGPAYAGGFILALSCDLRVASRNATFCVAGVRIGLLPVGGQLSRLLGVMPHARALEMALTAAPMTAEEAHGLGFVNRLVEERERCRRPSPWQRPSPPIRRPWCGPRSKGSMFRSGTASRRAKPTNGRPARPSPATPTPRRASALFSKSAGPGSRIDNGPGNEPSRCPICRGGFQTCPSWELLANRSAKCAYLQKITGPRIPRLFSPACNHHHSDTASQP